MNSVFWNFQKKQLLDFEQSNIENFFDSLGLQIHSFRGID